MGHAPRAQLAIGGLPRIDVHERRRLLVDRNRKFQGKVARLPLVTLAIFPVRQHGAVDAERLEPLRLGGFSREPSEGRPLDRTASTFGSTITPVGSRLPLAGVRRWTPGIRRASRFPRLTRDGRK